MISFVARAAYLSRYLTARRLSRTPRKSGDTIPIPESAEEGVAGALAESAPTVRFPLQQTPRIWPLTHTGTPLTRTKSTAFPPMIVRVGRPPTYQGTRHVTEPWFDSHWLRGYDSHHELARDVDGSM